MMNVIEFKIDKNGNWFYLGEIINQKELVCFLSALLTREEDGRYFLIFEGEKKEVLVEDAPFIIIESYRCGEGENQVISFRTCTDRIITLDGSAKIIKEIADSQEKYYVVFDGNMKARISKLTMYDLFDFAEGNNDCKDGHCGIWSRKEFFFLG